MALGQWTNLIDGVDDASSDSVNLIGNAVVEAEKRLDAVENNKLPKVSISDKGKFLRVNDMGNWTAQLLEIAEESEY